ARLRRLRRRHPGAALARAPLHQAACAPWPAARPPCRPARGDARGQRRRTDLGLRTDAGAVRAALQHARADLRPGRGARAPARALVPRRVTPQHRRPGRGAFRALRRNQATVSFTSTLPRVAFEYGHTSCAAATSFSAASRSRPGPVIRIATSIPKAPALPVSGPIETSASIFGSPASFVFWRAATAFIAPRKQAE